MTSDERNFRAWLEVTTAKYAKILLLDKYVFKFELEPQRKSGMACSFRHPYLDITLYYGPSTIADWKKDIAIARHYVVHELCHVITDPFYDCSIERFVARPALENEREHLTDHIATIIRKLGV
jgi:hypothetical protein